MRHILWAVLISAASFSASAVECGSTDTCVVEEDMALFLQVLEEKRCMGESKPTFRFDPIQVTEDQYGRMFVSGGNSYKVHFDWCTYSVDATANLTMQVAKYVPPEMGFRYRLKVAPGYLPLEALSAQNGYAGLDVGVLVESFFFQSLNINGYVGVRSVGVGLGLDLTRNMGLYAGYALTLGSWLSGPHVALTFSLW